MKKDRAIELLGGTPKKAAEAMGYRAVQTIYLWPEDLPQATADRVMGVVGRIAKAAKRRRPNSPSKEQGRRSEPLTSAELLPLLPPNFLPRVQEIVGRKKGVDHG